MTSEVGHKWEGAKCTDCGHSENLHSGKTGMCFAPNCGCFKYIQPNIVALTQDKKEESNV